jgi:hypothetical protein
MAELTRRYVVMPLTTPACFNLWDPDAVFVLKPWKDPAALQAIKTYQRNCYPDLARDLEAWVRLIEDGPIIRGDVGRRNEPYASRAGSPAAPLEAVGRPAARPQAAARRQARPGAKKRRR